MSTISIPAFYAAYSYAKRYSAAVEYFELLFQSMKRLTLFHTISCVIALPMKDLLGKYWDTDAQKFHQDFLSRMEKARLNKETTSAESQKLSKQEEKGRRKTDLTPMPHPVSG